MGNMCNEDSQMLCVIPARQFAVSFAQSGTFTLPHVRHSNQSNAKEPASPARDCRTTQRLTKN